MLLQSSFLLAQAFSKPESLPGHDHPRPMGGADLLDDVQVRLRPLSMLGFHPGPWPMGGADLSDEVAPRRLPMLGSDPGALPELASALEPRPSFDCRPEPDVGEAATFSGQSRAAAAKLASHTMGRKGPPIFFFFSFPWLTLCLIHGNDRVGLWEVLF